MAKFYLIGKISEELMKRMQNDPSADRYASTKKVTEAAGLKLISYEWVRGRFDVISCVEGEFEQAIALKIAFKNSGLMDYVNFNNKIYLFIYKFIVSKKNTKLPKPKI